MRRQADIFNNNNNFMECSEAENDESGQKRIGYLYIFRHFYVQDFFYIWIKIYIEPREVDLSI